MPNPEDDALIAVLETVAASARPYLAHQRREARAGRFLTGPEPDRTNHFMTVSRALQDHPEFQKATRRVFGGKQLNAFPQAIALPLVPVACDRGAALAVDWLRKVAHTERADVRYVAEVHGLAVDRPIYLSNGVRLIPLDQLPPSSNAFALMNQFVIRPGHFPLGLSPPCIGILECLNVPDDGGVDGRFPPEIAEAVRGFTLVDKAAPVVGMSWVEFVDAELELAEAGQMWMPARYEGLRPSYPIPVDDEAIGWMERYLGLHQHLHGRCNIAIARLNTARRRANLADRAIELGIALEALFGGGSTGELTYKLRLRTALYLGDTLEERRQISKDVNELYKLRSRAVHGQAVGDERDANNRAIIERGLELCALALRKMVSTNIDYQPELWDLSGGEPPAEE